MPEKSSASKQRMQCMEVWGGNMQVQQALTLPGLDVWILSVPHEKAEQGGDIHYISACGSGRVTRLLVADVSGHGQAVSAVAMDLRKLMQRYVNFIDQSRLVRRLNARFYGHAGQDHFATAIISTYFAPTRHFTVSNAGHPPPLVYRAQERAWDFIEVADAHEKGVGNLPLGVVPESHYGQSSIQLNPGDLALFYTDSLWDVANKDGEILGKEGVLSMVSQVEPNDPPAFIPKLLATVRESCGNGLDHDDLTLMLVRCTGQGVRAPMREAVKSPLKFLRLLVTARRSKEEPIPWPEWSIPNILGVIFNSANKRWRPR